MREVVCIVLNEREPIKAALAAKLEHELRQTNITASRLTADAQSAEVLLARHPRVVVLDYLLEDFGSGFDLLAAFKALPERKRPKVIFLTDEPSVAVAVEALREGATHFIELEHPAAVARTVEEVKRLLADSAELPEHASRVLPKFTDLVALAASSAATVRTLRSAATRGSPLTVLLGPPGSGLTTLARALHRELARPACLTEIDLRTCVDHFEDAVDFLIDGARGFGINHDHTVVVEHIEEDDGELLELVASRRAEWWPQGHCIENNSRIVLTSSDPSAARAWQRVTDAEIIEVPALGARHEDLPALVQRFVAELADQLKGAGSLRSVTAESTTMRWIAEQPWHGNLRQLRAALHDAAARFTFTPKAGFLELLKESTHACEKNVLEIPADEIPLSEIMATLAANRFSYRITAAKLGLPAKTLHALLRPASAGRSRAHEQGGRHE